MQGQALFFALILLAVHHSWATLGWQLCYKSFVSSTMTPSTPEGAIQLCERGMLAIAYDPKMVNPAWSAYYVTPQDLNHTIPGRLSFFEDCDLLRIGINQASPSSAAFNTSWNRGHLAPSHIMSYSAQAKHTCYTMANIAPQEARFNQQPWRELEDKVYNWVKSVRPLHIITGVSYDNRTKPQRSLDDIAVPDYYWKIICDKQTAQSAGFIGRNNHTAEGMGKFFTVQDVEALYGGRLFPNEYCRTSVVNESHWWEF